MLEQPKQKVGTIFLDLLYYTVGGALFAVALQMFIAPNQIAPGGVSAVAVVLNYLIPAVQIGAWSILLNIPILLCGLKFLGKPFTLRTLMALLIMSVLTDLFYYVTPPYHGDPLLAALFSGVLMGAGMALVFMRDSTTGGVDIISRLIQRRMPHMPMGRLLLMLDVVIIGGSALVFGKFETVLYSIISVFVCSRTIDSVLYGLDRGKLVYVISPQNEIISQRIIGELERGCTLLQAVGGFSKTSTQALMVAVRAPQFHKLKTIVQEEDANAFMIVTDSSEVLGEGFKSIAK